MCVPGAPWRRRFRSALRRASVLLALALGGCGETTDSLGYDRPGFAPLAQPEYRNALYEGFRASDNEISAKIRKAFEMLFESQAVEERIFFLENEQQGYVKDIYNDDIRTEGMSYGMLIAVQLNRQRLFDQLWAYAKAKLMYKEGDAEELDRLNAGYFRSFCSTNPPVEMTWRPCADPFGHQQFIMALIFASNRWGRDSGNIDYVADARELLRVMRQKEEDNGGIVRGVTNMFDERAKLVVDVPEESAAGTTRPSILMPAYYELWFQATGDTFWQDAAVAARIHWREATHPMTGLTPLRAHFGGSPVEGSAIFLPEGYRMQLNLALDHIWFGRDPWQIEASNRLLQFFLSKGFLTYGTSYTIEGEAIETDREVVLHIVNGVTAGAATIEERQDFLQTAWDFTLEPSDYRYYQGLLDLMALLILSGRYRVF